LLDRKYAWNSLPNIIPHYIQEDLRWYRVVGVAGVSTYAEPGDWFTYELSHCVLGRLAWDPDTKVGAVIDEFCTARYGPEAALAREVFAGLESIVRHACSLPGTRLKTVAEQRIRRGSNRFG
jgi:alpha-glucuronidase